MNIAIWVHEYLNAEKEVLIGGVQTYIQALVGILKAQRHKVTLVTIGHKTSELEVNETRILEMPMRDWYNPTRIINSTYMELKNCINIVANAHACPKGLRGKKVGIQHGIYWDRPAKSSIIGRILPLAANIYRSVKGARAINSFDTLVCVDFVYPTMAACIYSPIPWSKIKVIPNFGPEPEKVLFTGNTKKIVFSRRFELHRGTEIFAKVAARVLESGWAGEVHFVGNGPEEAALKKKFEKSPKVKFYSLSFKDRLEAFDRESIVVVPSLSTEGTSLTILEAWSKGALVIATCVGGITNLVVDQHNGLLVRPIESDIHNSIMHALENQEEACNIRKRGQETLKTSFSFKKWSSDWIHAISDLEK